MSNVLILQDRKWNQKLPKLAFTLKNTVKMSARLVQAIIFKLVYMKESACAESVRVAVDHLVGPTNAIVLQAA